VASGDVTHDRAVLWARAGVPGRLEFRWWADGFHPAGRETVRVPDPAVPARVEARWLRPGTSYRYQVTHLGTGDRLEGRFRTPARWGYHGLRFGATGDWQQAPPYPSLKNVAQRGLDVFLKLGDTIYADTETPALPGVVQARTLPQFRIKHREVASPRPETGLFNVMPELTRAQALLSTIDDHEIVDNFAGGARPGESPDAGDVHPGEPPLFDDPVQYVNQTMAYRDALQAYREHHPVRLADWWTPFDPRMDGAPRLYRRQTYGRDAAIILLDSRSFRDAQLAPVGNPLDPASVGAFLFRTYDPTRTMLGRAQLERLQIDLLAAEASGVTWKFVVIPEPIQNFGVVNAEDRFEGYAFERDRLLRFIDEKGIDNVVFIAGDFHGTLVNNLTYRKTPLDPVVTATSAIEVVTGPAAFFSGLFGPAVTGLAFQTGLLSGAEYAFYQSLPSAAAKDAFVKALLNAQLAPLGYDPMGLDSNLPHAASRFEARLLRGDYVTTHVFAWAEFDVDRVTQVLNVKIWGVPPHSEADLASDPEGVVARTPEVVLEFELTPRR
jgi:phosphodiesterase/alkaline phosphatase D-like protein